MFDGICEALHREMDQLDEKFANGAKMNAQELDTIDRIAHTLKSIAGYEMARKNSEWDNSYARSRTTGRYVSRDYRY